MDWKRGYAILLDAAKNFMADQAMQLGAALAYFSMFSIAPLLIIAIAIAGAVFGAAAAEGGVTQSLTKWVGADGASTITKLILNARHPAPGTIATIVSVVIIIFGASGVFSQLRYSLNTIWGVAWKPSLGLWGTVRDRAVSIAAVVVTGVLLMATLVLNAVLSAVGSYFGHILPGGSWPWQTLNQLVSLGFLALVFALIFRFLPDTRMYWQDAAAGGAFTALLFTLGKFVLGWYIGKYAGVSVYGAASSFVAVLVWVFYSSLIFYYGAEFTRSWAAHHGRKIIPGPEAILLSQALAEERASAPEQQPRVRPGTRSQMPPGPSQPH